MRTLIYLVGPIEVQLDASMTYPMADSSPSPRWSDKVPTRHTPVFRRRTPPAKRPDRRGRLLPRPRPGVAGIGFRSSDVAGDVEIVAGLRGLRSADSTPPSRTLTQRSNSTPTRTAPAVVYRGRDAVQRYNADLFGQFESLRVEVRVRRRRRSRNRRERAASGRRAVGGRSRQIAERWTVRSG